MPQVQVLSPRPLFLKRVRRAGVAQLVEQLICNQQVGGSSPSTSSTLLKIIKYGRVPERPKGADCKSVVNDFGGPNPPSPTKNPHTKVWGFFFVDNFQKKKPADRNPILSAGFCCASIFNVAAPPPASERKEADKAHNGVAGPEQFPPSL